MGRAVVSVHGAAAAAARAVVVIVVVAVSGAVAVVAASLTGAGPAVLLVPFRRRVLGQRRRGRRGRAGLGRRGIVGLFGGEGVLALRALHPLAQELIGHLQMFLALRTGDQLSHRFNRASSP